MVKSAEGRVWDNGKGLSLRAGMLRRGVYIIRYMVRLEEDDDWGQME